jgi:hypothetical protein
MWIAKKAGITWNQDAKAQHDAKNKRMFATYMDVARAIAAKDRSRLQLMVNLVARQTQAELLSAFALHKFPRHVGVQDLLFAWEATLTDMLAQCEERVVTDAPFHISDYVLLPWPWKPERVIENLTSVATEEKPWKYDPANHRVHVLRPFNVGFVGCGNHSIATGLLTNSGTIEEYRETDLAPMYDYVQCDGAYFRRKSDNAILCAAPDFPLGVVFEIGRLML